jgi:hypothetical protein
MIDAFGRSIVAGTIVDPAEDGLSQMKVLDELNRQAHTVQGPG